MSHTFVQMNDANPTPENPYAAPESLPIAELVPAPRPTEPQQLPCHRCGRMVRRQATVCLGCGARPKHDYLRLALTTVLVLALVNFVPMLFDKRAQQSPDFVTFMGVVALTAALLLALITLRRPKVW